MVKIAPSILSANLLEIKKKYSNVLTIIVPRHIERSFYISDISKKLNLNTQVLNDNDSINFVSDPKKIP